MTEHHDHRDDCPFKFATLDVCDCVEKNMLDRIEALTKERDEAVHLARMRKTFTEEARDERDAAEAKLAKAVEALKDMCLEFRQADLPYGSAAYAKATATLAAVSETHKIKGESND